MDHMVARLRIVLSCLLVVSLGACGGSQTTSHLDASAVTGGSGGYAGTGGGPGGGGGGTGGQLSTATSFTPPLCVPGASVACACVTGQTGAQTCTSAGTFAACVCAAPAADAGSLGGAGGTTATTTPSGTGGVGGAGPGGGTTVPAMSNGGAGGSGTGGQPVVDAAVADAMHGSAVCGNGIVEGTEGCDDGNTMPFDGCSEDCQVELDCSGASCTSKCGDGIVVAPEQCDDGNTIDGDGCSKDCTVEPGWICMQPPLGNEMMVPVIYRDFRFHNPPEFEAGGLGSDQASRGLVDTNLDADGKPAYAGTGGNITSAGTFAEWYRTTPGVNDPTASKLALWNNGQGAYVNRYGPNGEQWNLTTTALWCGTVGSELVDANGNPEPCTFQFQQSATNPTGGLTDCQEEAALGYTMLKCYQNGTTWSATFVVSKMDGNPLFFPIDSDPFSADQLEAAQIFPMYDLSGTYPYDLDASGNEVMHNFSFTSEVRYWFKYDSANQQKLDFVGDDDLWVFINKKLAVDLGGVHGPVLGSITLDATSASQLGLTNGQVYEVDVFSAERQTTGSAYQATLMGFNTAPSVCTLP